MKEEIALSCLPLACGVWVLSCGPGSYREEAAHSNRGGGCFIGTVAGQQVQEAVTGAWKENANFLAPGKPEAAPLGVMN